MNKKLKINILMKRIMKKKINKAIMMKCKTQKMMIKTTYQKKYTWKKLKIKMSLFIKNCYRCKRIQIILIKVQQRKI